MWFYYTIRGAFINAPLSREYNFLFRSLFNEATLHKQVIEALASKASGLTRTEIMEATKIEDGGALTKAKLFLTTYL